VLPYAARRSDSKEAQRSELQSETPDLTALPGCLPAAAVAAATAMAVQPTSSLLKSLEDKRTKIKVPQSTLKKLDKQLQQRKIFWNEVIQIKCPNKDGVAGPGALRANI
jgi:hypothetical protein